MRKNSTAQPAFKKLYRKPAVETVAFLPMELLRDAYFTLYRVQCGLKKPNAELDEILFALQQPCFGRLTLFSEAEQKKRKRRFPSWTSEETKTDEAIQENNRLLQRVGKKK